MRDNIFARSTDANAKEYAFMPVYFGQQAFQLDNSITYNKTLLLADQVILESYTTLVLFAALVTLDAENQPFNFSATLCIE